MVDIVAGPLLDNPALRAQGLDALPTTTGDAMAAVAGDTLHDNLAGRLFRGLSQELATTLAQGEQEGTVSGATTPDGRPVGALLSADQANERYGIRGNCPSTTRWPSWWPKTAIRRRATGWPASRC